MAAGVLGLQFSTPLAAQYSGPAILSRGEAPASLVDMKIRFRPFVQAFAVYDTGLSDASLTAGNQLASASSVGYGVSFGVSGSHSWRRASLGLSYTGSFAAYENGKTIPWTLTHSAMIGYQYRLARHAQLSLAETAGLFTRPYNTATLAQTVPFDPSQSYTPTTDYFDNRTIYATTQAHLSVQRSARTSLSFGGVLFVNKRDSKALASSVGEGATGDYQYRVTRATTIGANYSYHHFGFSNFDGGTDVHALSATYAIRVSRYLEFSAYGGAARIESKFVRSVPVDPLITALLGITQSTQVFHMITTTPTVVGRLSRRLPSGVVYVSGGRSISPGNGLFLTSIETVAMAGYTYSGLRRWSFSSQAGLSRAEALDVSSGNYNTYTAGLSGSRTLGRSLHLSVSYSLRQYNSREFEHYNRLINTATVGLAFSPGEVPLRLW